MKCISENSRTVNVACAYRKYVADHNIVSLCFADVLVLNEVVNYFTWFGGVVFRPFVRTVLTYFFGNGVVCCLSNLCFYLEADVA
ncbi:hypothetical protein FQZ97_1084310 [compost metagenome]